MTKSKPISFSYLRKSAFICGFFFFLGASGVAFAQGGGKAEPKRIKVKSGATTSTIDGEVRNDQQAEYVFSARRGQRLTIKLIDVPAKSSCFDLRGPDNVDVGLEYDCNWTYAKALPATGDYFMSVSRPSQAKGTSRYRLTVTLR